MNNLIYFKLHHAEHFAAAVSCNSGGSGSCNGGIDIEESVGGEERMRGVDHFTSYTSNRSHLQVKYEIYKIAFSEIGTT